METKTAFITGIPGQDASHLSKFLLEKDYKVIGMKRRCSQDNPNHIKELMKNARFQLCEGDLTDTVCMLSLLNQHKPDEIYNLAAQSHVATSFEQPLYTTQVNYVGVLNLLEWLRKNPETRLYQASTSEMFGSNYNSRVEHIDGVKLETKYQDENTPFSPNSPYAIAKMAAHNAIHLYRTAYNLYCCAGILFNHEGPLRGPNFVTRKISQYFANLYCWFAKNPHPHPGKLKLGNINAYRDWGYAGDYVEAMWLMLQQENADDYVVATGVPHSVRDFLCACMDYIGINYSNLDEWIEIDKSLFRGKEVPYLCGDASKAREKLGWKPKVQFKQLVKMMIDHDVEAMQNVR